MLILFIDQTLCDSKLSVEGLGKTQSDKGIPLKREEESACVSSEV